MIEIRCLEADLIEAAGTMGPAAYGCAYADVWDDAAALARHLETFGAAAFRTLLGDREARCWIALEAGAPVGFATLHISSPDPVSRLPGGGELRRLYILPPAQRRGLGRKMLSVVESAAREAGCVYLWLDVLASASRARAAYASWGFRDIGSGRLSLPVRAAETPLRIMTLPL